MRGQRTRWQSSRSWHRSSTQQSSIVLTPRSGLPMCWSASSRARCPRTGWRRSFPGPGRPNAGHCRSGATGGMTQNSQGTTVRPKLDDEAFEAFIRARRPASPIWSMSGLDGYLTALIIGPKFIDPRKWIPELTGPEALNLPMETREHRAVQTIVAEYNRISASLSETPKDHRPRFTRIDDQTLISSIWDLCFLLGNRIRAEAVGSRSSWSLPSMGYHRTHPQARRGKTESTSQDAADVAEALVNIQPTLCRSGKAEVLTERQKPIVNHESRGHSLRSPCSTSSRSSATIAGEARRPRLP